jgi:hypothetical protein
MNGHTTHAALAEAFSIAPNHWLQKRMIQILAELGQPWDEKADYFHIEDGTLYRLRKGESEIEQLPALVQTYAAQFLGADCRSGPYRRRRLVVTDQAPGRGAGSLDLIGRPSGVWGGAPRIYKL